MHEARIVRSILEIACVVVLACFRVQSVLSDLYRKMGDLMRAVMNNVTCAVVRVSLVQWLVLALKLQDSKHNAS